MSQKQAGRDEPRGIRVNHPDPRESEEPTEQQLKGVSRLVNPPSDDPEIISGDEDQGERDYLGRLLHAADKALRHVKRGFFHRTRRGRLH